MTIATDDGGIVVIEVEDDGDGKNTFVLTERLAKNYITDDRQKWMLKELGTLGVVTTEDLLAYEEEKQRKIEEARIKIQQQREEHDRREFERLKAKYQ